MSRSLKNERLNKSKTQRKHLNEGGSPDFSTGWNPFKEIRQAVHSMGHILADELPEKNSHPTKNKADYFLWRWE